MIVLIAVAAVFDALDGRTARRFKTQSAFGAALDGLSDLVVFGVVPALCLFVWALQDSGNMRGRRHYSMPSPLRCGWPVSIQNCQTHLIMRLIILPASRASGWFLVLMPIVIDLQFGLEVVGKPYVSVWLVLIGAVRSVPCQHLRAKN